MYTVRSTNFDYHPVIECPTYSEALTTAKRRGWEALISLDSEPVAGWSPIYGTKIYRYDLAK